jgi:glycerate kinase
VADASVVITGEGAYDGQSAHGKVPSHVGRLAAPTGTRVALVAGRISPDASTGAFAASISLTELAGSAERAMQQPEHWLRRAGAALAEQFAG